MTWEVSLAECHHCITCRTIASSFVWFDQCVLEGGGSDEVEVSARDGRAKHKQRDKELYTEDSSLPGTDPCSRPYVQKSSCWNHSPLASPSILSLHKSHNWLRWGPRPAFSGVENSKTSRLQRNTEQVIVNIPRGRSYIELPLLKQTLAVYESLWKCHKQTDTSHRICLYWENTNRASPEIHRLMAGFIKVWLRTVQVQLGSEFVKTSFWVSVI